MAVLPGRPRAREERAGKALRATRAALQPRRAGLRPRIARTPSRRSPRRTRAGSSGWCRIRMERMAESAFGFYRGAAAIMAGDLAHTPVTGLTVQLGGDAHCMNFGGFATPERNLLFDINDFDETMPGPWEWDLKRLVTSIVVAARHNAFAGRDAKVAALAAAQAYRLRMHELAASSALEVWYARLDAAQILDAARSAAIRRRRSRIRDQAATDTVRAAVAKFTELVDGKRRFADDPPLMYHSAATERRRLRRRRDRRDVRVESAARRAGAARPLHADRRRRQGGRRRQRRHAVCGRVVRRRRRRRVHPADQRGAAVGAFPVPGRRASSRTTASASCAVSASCRRRPTCSSAGRSPASAAIYLRQFRD